MLLSFILLDCWRPSYFMYSLNLFTCPHTYFSYTCVYVDTYRDQKLFQWNVSVSDHCCLHCDDVVYKADTVIDTIQYEDECKTTETTVCRTIPGYVHVKVFNNSKILFKGYQKALVEYEFNYRNCCNDEDGKYFFCFSKLIFSYSGLSALETTKLEPKSCSQRFCYYKDALLSSTWISSKVLLNPETSSELTSDYNNSNLLFRFCLDVTAVLWMDNLFLMDIHGHRMEKFMVQCRV